MKAPIVRAVLRGVIAFNFAFLLITDFRAIGRAYVHFIKWAGLGNADIYWIIGTTAALPLLLVIEIVQYKRRSPSDSAGGKWLERCRGILIDGALVFAWITFLYVEAATHIAWL